MGKSARQGEVQLSPESVKAVLGVDGSGVEVRVLDSGLHEAPEPENTVPWCSINPPALTAAVLQESSGLLSCNTC